MRIGLVFVSCSFFILPSAFPQGGLTPPAPPGPTMQTLDQLGAKADQANAKLDQVNTKADTIDAKTEKRIPIDAEHTPPSGDELFRISASGSYYLTGNITGVSGKAGIVIAASDVTLDLNGFDLIGTSGSLQGVTLPPIPPNPPLQGIKLRNGRVRNWDNYGIFLALSTTNVVVEDLEAIGNTNAGIVVGTKARVSQCVATANGAAGIIGQDAVEVTDCVADGNSTAVGGAGISVVTQCIVTRSVANNNANGSTGISVSSKSIVSYCSASNNGGSGISTGGSDIIDSCVVVLNAAHGISTGASQVINCQASDNTLDGIHAVSDCRITNNNCTSNGLNPGDGAGIHVTGSGNVIDDNRVTGADRGIDAPNSGNLIIRNRASGNTLNYNIGANNHIGPIVITSGNGSAINTNVAAASTLNSADPWANFSY